MMPRELPPGFQDVLSFSLGQAIQGRRARRFSLGASIPEGELSYTSSKKPVPLDEVERALILACMAGNNGWHYMHAFNPLYAPHLPNYSGSAWGRTFPSAAGFHTSELFFTDDEGVFFLPTRDGGLSLEGLEDGGSFMLFIDALRDRAVKLSNQRLNIPRREAHMESHNHWSVNLPGSLLVIPVADLAQHMLLALCYLVQNGFGIYDDVHRTAVEGLEEYKDLIDPGKLYPLSFLELQSVTECSIEMGASCYAGMLMLQAMGLGGWMFDGIDPFSVLGASGDPDMPGLGFRFDTDERWTLPNPTGLEGVFEGTCPPHYRDMRAAVEFVVERKFGPGGPFNEGTPGPWRDNAEVRGSAQVHDEEFKRCVTLMAQHVLDRFGKFPGTVPTMWTQIYLQAHHLDLEFYDRKFKPGAYLRTHATHMERWHPE